MSAAGLRARMTDGIPPAPDADPRGLGIDARWPGESTQRAWRLLVVLLFAVMAARLASLGLYPLSDTTEARYAEIARRMLETGDWVTPWYADGVPFWGKPPLSIWLTAASMGIFGVNEWAARLPHFLAGVWVSWSIWNWMRPTSPRRALLAVAWLWGTALFLVAAGAVMTDMAMLVGVVMAMKGFWRGVRGGRSWFDRYGLFVGLAIGLLAKGPIALVLISLPIGLWVLSAGWGRRAWTRLPWISGALLASAIALPWYLLAEAKTPGFLDYFLVGEHFSRFVQAGWAGDRYGNAQVRAPGTIWLFALVACLPWAVLLPAMALACRGESSRVGPFFPPGWSRYLWLWALAPCVFFTLSRNILWTYALPSLVPLSMLAASWLVRTRNLERAYKFAALGPVLTALVLGAGLVVAYQSQSLASAKGLAAAMSARSLPFEDLVVVGRHPYSARFYTAGRARHIESFEALDPLLQERPPRVRYVAIPADATDPRSARLRSMSRLVGTFEPYSLHELASP